MKKILIILFFGIILRIFLSFSTYHSDIQTFNLSGKIIAEGNILNFYNYLSTLDEGDVVKTLTVFNYPPPVYWFHGLFNFIFNKIFQVSIINDFILNTPSNYGNLFFNISLTLIKLPYLIFDLATGFLLYKMFNEKRQKQLVLTLWMFNPINLYATYMIGQFDIIPTFFVILSLLLLIRNKLPWAALALGFGIAFKLYPIFLIVPLIIFAKNNLEKVKLILLSLLPYVISVTPYLHSQYFRSQALFASQSSKSLYAVLPISGGESILIFPAILVFFYIVIFQNKERVTGWKVFSIPLLLFFIFTHFHPQWLIWLTPFFILDLVKNGYRNLLPLFIIFISYLGSIFFFDPGLNTRLFAPLIPILKDLPSIWTILNMQPDYNSSRSLLHTIFTGASFYFVYKYFYTRAHD